MRRKILTPTGEQDVRQIFAHILTDNPDAASRFYESAMHTFFEFPDDIQTPAKAEIISPSTFMCSTLGDFEATRFVSRFLLRRCISSPPLHLVCRMSLRMREHSSDCEVCSTVSLLAKV